MAAGRCAGCGKTGSVRHIQIHAVTCEQFQQRFRSDPAGCPDPAAEHRHHSSTGTAMHDRADARDRRLQLRFTELDLQQQQAELRWATPKDLLAD